MIPYYYSEHARASFDGDLAGDDDLNFLFNFPRGISTVVEPLIIATCSAIIFLIG